MPVPFDPDEQIKEGLALPTQEPPTLPPSQAAPFLEALRELNRAQLVPVKALEAETLDPFRSNLFREQGVFQPGIFGAPEAPVPVDLRNIAQQLLPFQEHTFDFSAEDAKFIPREETEPKGFWKILDLLARTLYATTGFVNATINAFQGEKEETNPLVEAWRGFTGKDREVWEDVFLNLGWDGQDKWSKRSRFWVGLASDMVLDPIMFILPGAGVGARLLGSGTKAIPLTAKKVKTAAGRLFKDGDAYIQAIREDLVIRLPKLGNVRRLEEDKARAISEALNAGEEFGAAFEIKQQALARHGVEITGEQLATARAFEGFVDDVVGRSLEKGDDFLSQMETAFLERGAVNKQDFFTAAFGDADVAHVWDSILRVEGLMDDVGGWNPHMVFDLLKDKKLGLNKLREPAGLRFGIPFTKVYTSLPGTKSIDKWMYAANVAAVRQAVKMRDIFKGAVSKKVYNVAAAPFVGVGQAWEFFGKQKDAVKRLLGLDLSKSPRLARIVVNHRSQTSASGTLAQAKAAELAGAIGTDKKVHHIVHSAIFDEDLAATARRAEVIPKELSDLNGGRTTFLPDGSGKPSLYEPQHLTQIASRLVKELGMDPDQAERVQKAAFSIVELMGVQGINLVRKGVIDNAKDIYITLRFKDPKKAHKLRFVEEGEGAQTVFKEKPVWAEMRTMTPSQMTKEFGDDVVEEDLVKLIFGKLYSNGAALANAQFLRQMKDFYWMSLDQVDRWLSLKRGPQGAFGLEISRALSQTIPGGKIIEGPEILRLVPPLKELKQLLDTGQYPAASKWLDDHSEFASTAFKELTDWLREMKLAGQADAHEFLSFFSHDYTETISRELGDKFTDVFSRVTASGDQLVPRANVSKEALDKADRAFLAGIGTLVEQRVRKALNITDEPTVLNLLGAGSVDEALKAGSDAVRIAILDEILLEERRSLSRVLLRSIETQQGKLVDDVARSIIGFIKERSSLPRGAVSSAYPGFEETFAILLSRMMPADLMEHAIDKSGRFLTGEITSGAKRDDIAQLFAQREAGNLSRKKLAQLAEAFGKTHGHHPIIVEAAINFRRRTGLPDLPLGLEWTPEASELLRMVRSVRDELGFRPGFLSQPIMVPFGAGRRVRKKRLAEIQKIARKWARGDEERVQDFFDLLVAGSISRAGYHYQPIKGINAVMETAFVGQYNQVLVKFQRLAEDFTPVAVTKKMQASRRKERLVVGQVFDMPPAFSKVTHENLKKRLTESRFAFLDQAKKTTADEKAINAVFGYIENYDWSIAPQRTLTEAWQGMQNMVDDFKTEIDRVFAKGPLREAVIKGLYDWQEWLMAEQRQFLELSKGVKGNRAAMNDATRNPKDFFGEQAPERLEEMNEVTQALGDAMTNVESRVQDVMKTYPIPPDSVLTEEVRRGFEPLLKAAQDYRGTMTRERAFTSPKAEAKLRQDAVEAGKAYQLAAEDAVKSLEAQGAVSVRDFDDVVQRSWALQAAGKSSAGARQRVNGLMSELMGAPVDIADPKSVGAALDAFLENRISWSGVNQTELVQNYVGMVVAQEFLERHPGGGIEEWFSTIRDVIAEGKVGARFAGFALLRKTMGQDGLATLAREFLNTRLPAGFGGVGAPRTIAEYRATNRFTATIQDADLGQMRDMGFRLLETDEFSALASLLDVEDFRATIATRAGEILATRETMELTLSRTADSILMRPEEVAERFQALRRETALIDAFRSVIQERRVSLGITQQGQASVQVSIEGVLIRGGDVDALQNAKTKTNELLGRVIDQDPSALEELRRFAVPEATLQQLASGTAIDRTLDAFNARLTEQIDLFYVEQSKALGDAPGLAEIRREGPLSAARAHLQAMPEEIREEILLSPHPFGHPNVEVAQEARRLAALLEDLDPGLSGIMEAGEAGVNVIRQLLAPAPGEPIARALISRGLANRGQYWLSQLGLATPSATGLKGAAGLDVLAARGMIEDMGNYYKSGVFADTYDLAEQGVGTRLTSTAAKHNEVLISTAYARRERDFVRDTVIPARKVKSDLNVVPSPENSGHYMTAMQFNQSLRYQTLSWQAQAIEDLRYDLPTRQEFAHFRDKALQQSPENAPQLSGASPLGPELIIDDEGRVVTSGLPYAPEQADVINHLDRVNYESLNERWSTVLGRPSRAVQKHFGVDPQQHPTRQLLLRALKARQVQGIADLGETFALDAAVLRANYGREATDSVVEIVEYLDHVAAGRNLGHHPILDVQMEQLNKMLDTVSQGIKSPFQREQFKTWALYSRSTRTRIDELTSLEAAFVINNLEQHTSVALGPTGKLLTGNLARDQQILVEPLVARGFLAEQINDGAAASLRSRALATKPEEIVSLQLTEGPKSIMDEITGVAIPTDQIVTTRLNLSIMQDVMGRADAVGREGARGLFLAAHKVTNMWKGAVTWPHPAFWLRNFADVAVRSMLAIGVAGFNPRNFKEVWDLLKGAPGVQTIREASGRVYTIDNRLVQEWMHNNGLVISFAEKLNLFQARTFDDYDPTSGAQSLAARYGRAFSNGSVTEIYKTTRGFVQGVNAGVDNFFRVGLFRHGLQSGMPVQEAARWTQKFIFDYGNRLTEFERKWLRLVIPFYGWFRNNIPLTLSVMYSNPGLLSAVGKTRDIMDNTDALGLEKILPQHIRDRWLFAPKIDEKKGELQIWSGSNLLFLEDLEFLTNLAFWRSGAFSDAFLDTFFSKLNPMIKFPIEMAVGRNFFFDRAIAEDQDVKEAIVKWPVIRNFLKFREVKVGDEIKFRVDGDRYLFLTQLHFSRIYRSISQLFGRDDLGAWERWAPVLTGLRMHHISFENRAKWLHLVAKRNENALTKAINEGDFETIRRIQGEVLRPMGEQQKLDEGVQLLRQLAETSALQSQF